MLEHHVKRKHPDLFKDALRSGAKKAPKVKAGKDQTSMDQFVAACPTFEECLLNWVIQTYQPIRICEEPTFRDLSAYLLTRSVPS